MKVASAKYQRVSRDLAIAVAGGLIATSLLPVQARVVRAIEFVDLVAGWWITSALVFAIGFGAVAAAVAFNGGSTTSARVQRLVLGLVVCGAALALFIVLLSSRLVPLTPPAAH